MGIFLMRETTICFGNRRLIMAKRICFISKLNEEPLYEEMEVEFKYFNGFAVSQKQKSIADLHKNIKMINPSLKILEISTKSTDPIGIALSAFNLKFFDENLDKEFALENIFQSSKVFEFGGPFRELLNVSPKDAKRDERLKISGNLKCFNYDNENWELEPKTMFYDWIYIKALIRNKELSKKILDFDCFTDIEFNQEKSINCQARSAAIFVSLCKRNIINEVISCKKKFKEIYYMKPSENVQISLFDNY